MGRPVREVGRGAAVGGGEIAAGGARVARGGGNVAAVGAGAWPCATFSLSIETVSRRPLTSRT